MSKSRFFILLFLSSFILTITLGNLSRQTNAFSPLKTECSSESLDLRPCGPPLIANIIFFQTEPSLTKSLTTRNQLLHAYWTLHLHNQKSGLYLYSTVSPPA